jgi:CheY-like chemotaxis protein
LTIFAADSSTKIRVLVVEDEAIVAMLTEDMLLDLGFEVGATASTVDEALKRVQEQQFDVALLDVNLRGEKVFPIADELLLRQLPFAFTTGYGLDGLREDLRNIPVAAKPFSPLELNEVLVRALGTFRQQAAESGILDPNKNDVVITPTNRMVDQEVPTGPTEFSVSSNGDKWFLDYEGAAGDHSVIHRASDASGGTETTWSVSNFLELFGDHPQGQALRQLLHNLRPNAGHSSTEGTPAS